ncbi:hypothetical protein Tco_1415608, partial [Tanacetum coccineum]
ARSLTSLTCVYMSFLAYPGDGRILDHRPALVAQSIGSYRAHLADGSEYSNYVTKRYELTMSTLNDVRIYAGYRCRTPDTFPEHIPEYRAGMLIWTQAESDVTMTRRRHGIHAAIRVVLIPKAKPDTVFEIPVLDHPLILTPEFGPGVTPRARLTRVVYSCAGITSC